MSRPFVAIALLLALCGAADAEPFSFSAGSPNGQMAVASRIASSGKIEIEAADDFVALSQTTIASASFYGLIPSTSTAADVSAVTIEIYRVFPLDSVSPPDGRVPVRVNSPSDVAFASSSSISNTLSAIVSVQGVNFTAVNSVVNGINPFPNQTTGGEGAFSGTEVLVSVTFTPPLVLPASHYFFVPQVLVTNANFLWLSAPKPIVSPGTPFTGDLQAWIRNATLDPDWLRIGTDIVGGAPAPSYNLAFGLSGTDEIIFRNGFD